MGPGRCSWRPGPVALHDRRATGRHGAGLFSHSPRMLGKGRGGERLLWMRRVRVTCVASIVDSRAIRLEGVRATRDAVAATRGATTLPDRRSLVPRFSASQLVRIGCPHHDLVSIRYTPRRRAVCAALRVAQGEGAHSRLRPGGPPRGVRPSSHLRRRGRPYPLPPSAARGQDGLLAPSSRLRRGGRGPSRGRPGTDGVRRAAPSVAQGRNRRQLSHRAPAVVTRSAQDRLQLAVESWQHVLTIECTPPSNQRHAPIGAVRARLAALGIDDPYQSAAGR